MTQFEVEFKRSVDLLLSLGFKEYDEDAHGCNRHWGGIECDNDDILFYDSDTNRNQIFIRISKRDASYSIYVLENIGFPAYELCFLWSDLEEEWLTHLKQAFTGRGFKKIK